MGSQLGLADESDSSLLEAFQQLGLEVKAFDYRATTFVPRWLSRWIPAWLRRFSPRRLPRVDQADALASNKQFVDCVEQFRPDLVIALQAERLTPATLQGARKTGAIFMNWIHDHPEGRVNPEIIPDYDCWLVWDVSAAKWLNQHGAKQVEFLPVACDPKRHYPVALSAAEKERWASKICFVGSFQPNRAAALAHVADMGLAIWGPGWEQAEDPLLKPCIRSKEALSREAWLKAYAGSDVVINIHSQGSEGLNLRVWEALGAGACLLSDYRPDIERFFGAAVATFRSPQEMRQHCTALLSDHSRRKRMASEGRERVCSEHTFRKRAERIMALAQALQTKISEPVRAVTPGKIHRILMVGTHIGLVDEADHYLERALQKCGAELRVFDILASAYAPQGLRRWAPPVIRKWFSPRKLLPAVDAMNNRLRNERFVEIVETFRPEAVIALRAERLSAQSLRMAKSLGAMLVNWTADIPEDYLSHDVVSLYDLWMIFDGSHRDWFIKHGAKRVEYLPLACDPAEHHPAIMTPQERAQWASRLCFVGSYSQRREEYFESVSDLGLAIWGPHWERARSPSLKKSIRASRYLRREEWLRAYSAADIVLSLQSKTQQGLSNRVWEALAARTCLVAEWTPAFDPSLQQVVGTFRSAREFRSACEELLSNPQRRSEMALQGQELVLAKHTYVDRARQMLAWIEECRGQTA